MPTTSYHKAIGGVCWAQPSIHNWLFETTISQCVNAKQLSHPPKWSQQWPITISLTKVINQKTRQASPECTHPIRGSQSQTSYPRVHIARQAIPRFNGKTPWIKRELQGGYRRQQQETERAEEKEDHGEHRSQSRNTLGHTHAAGS